MARTWQLQEAKNSLSKVVDLAVSDGPQTVTRHGRAVAVIISQEDFQTRRRGSSGRGSLLPFLRSLSFRGVALDVSRAKDSDRDVEL